MGKRKTEWFKAVKSDDVTTARKCYEKRGGGIVRKTIDFLDLREDSGKTALQIACELGREKIVGFLIEIGAQLNCELQSGRSPLQIAIESQHSNVAIRLLEGGADPNKLSSDNRHPLHIATEFGQERTVIALLDKTKEVDSIDRITGQTPLHIAAHFGYGAIIKLLLDAKASTDVKDKQAKRPVDYITAKELRALFGEEDPVLPPTVDSVATEKRGESNTTPSIPSTADSGARRPTESKEVPARSVEDGSSQKTVHVEFYELLGVEKSAGDAELKKGYRKAAIKYHPDKNPGPDGQALFTRIGYAYKVLSDPKKRAVYDAHGEDGVEAYIQEQMRKGEVMEDEDVTAVFKDLQETATQKVEVKKADDFEVLEKLKKDFAETPRPASSAQTVPDIGEFGQPRRKRSCSVSDVREAEKLSSERLHMSREQVIDELKTSATELDTFFDNIMSKVDEKNDSSSRPISTTTPSFGSVTTGQKSAFENFELKKPAANPDELMKALFVNERETPEDVAEQVQAAAILNSLDDIINSMNSTE
eukprot:Colp12_sorted_trinity150504_noHs@11294